jgi:hypothetical protein
MENDVVYIRAQDWWLEPIPEDHCLQLLKSIYGTLQAACRWHKHISAWMEANGYLEVNREKTIFMKREGKHFIIHGLFVDDMGHQQQAQERVHVEVLEGLQHHWRRLHEAVLRHGD